MSNGIRKDKLDAWDKEWLQKAMDREYWRMGREAFILFITLSEHLIPN